MNEYELISYEYHRDMYTLNFNRSYTRTLTSSQITMALDHWSSPVPERPKHKKAYERLYHYIRRGLHEQL